MNASIPKRAHLVETARTPAYFYDSARAGMRDLLENGPSPRATGGGVLLPAYIGWSAHEGSGVFDPVRESGRPYGFYRVSNDLALDIDALEQELRSGAYQYVVVIHYFGRLEPRLARIREIADDVGAVVIEDLAHGFFSAVRSASMRSHASVAMYSLHKQFPVEDGGMVVYRDPTLVVAQGSLRADLATEVLSYDWADIAVRRRRNFRAIVDELRRRTTGRSEFTLIWPELNDLDVPQTLPVALHNADRDVVYAEMNAAGFGMVSLYHTLIEELRGVDAAIDRLSRKIINFPVHQDVDPALIPSMVDSFMAAVARHRGGEHT